MTLVCNHSVLNGEHCLSMIHNNIICVLDSINQNSIDLSNNYIYLLVLSVVQVYKISVVRMYSTHKDVQKPVFICNYHINDN